MIVTPSEQVWTLGHGAFHPAGRADWSPCGMDYNDQGDQGKTRGDRCISSMMFPLPRDPVGTLVYSASSKFATSFFFISFHTTPGNSKDTCSIVNILIDLPVPNSSAPSLASLNTWPALLPSPLYILFHIHPPDPVERKETGDDAQPSALGSDKVDIFVIANIINNPSTRPFARVTSLVAT